MKLMDGSIVPAGATGSVIKTTGPEQEYAEVTFDHLSPDDRVMVTVRELEALRRGES